MRPFALATSLLWLATAAWGEPLPTTGPATQPTITELRRVHRASFERNLENLSSLPARPIHEVVRLSIVDGMLLIDSPTGPTGGIHRIELTDAPGVATLNVVENERVGSRWFTFEHVDFDRPGYIYNAVNLHARDNGGQFSFETMGVEENLMVQLLENFEASDEPDARVKLYVQRFQADTEELLGKVSVSAARFDTLLEEHREPMLRYVIGPLATRGLHRGILSPPAGEAWQVLGDEIDPPADVIRSISELLAKLDSDLFADRQAAEQELARLGPRGAIALRRWDRSTLTAQQVQSIDNVAAAYSRKNDRTASRLREDPLFLIGVLYSDEKDLWPAAAEKLAALVPSGKPIDPSAPAEQVRAAADEMVLALTFTPPATQPAGR